MTSRSRKARRRAMAEGRCPNCLERPVDHVIPIDLEHDAMACDECWPELVAQLHLEGFTVSGCIGPCCAKED